MGFKEWKCVHYQDHLQNLYGNLISVVQHAGYQYLYELGPTLGNKLILSNYWQTYVHVHVVQTRNDCKRCHQSVFYLFIYLSIFHVTLCILIHHVCAFCTETWAWNIVQYMRSNEVSSGDIQVTLTCSPRHYQFHPIFMAAVGVICKFIDFNSILNVWYLWVELSCE